MVAFTFNPDSDIPDLSGKVILITGGTNGIGRESIVQFAKHNPEHIYFSGRNSARADELISRIKQSNPGVKLTFISCDLSSLDSVKDATQQFDSERLDILICNGGILAGPPGLSKDDYEIQFATNQLGHSLLVKLLLPKLLSTAKQPDSDVRIVILTSLAALDLQPRNGINFDTLKTNQRSLLPFASFVRYGQSKLAGLLYAAELARRHPEITSVSVHPGVVQTDMVNKSEFLVQWSIKGTNARNMLAPEQGAYNQLWASTCNKAELVNGEFYEPVGVKGRHYKKTTDKELASRLWEWSEQELAAY